jgi:RNA polymerase sigma-70 factor (ECF subfamily)
MKEERLIMLLRSDPNEGMKKVIDAYSGLVFSIVRGRLSGLCGSAEIEDCAAEVFIRFNSALDGLRTDGSVRNYLAVIARNTSSNYLRSKSSEAAVDGEEALR